MQSGKSFIKFIIIIIVLAGIITWGVQILLKEIEHKDLETIHTDMLLIQAKAKLVFERYHVDNNNGLKGEKIENNTELEQYGITDNTNYFIWNKDVLNDVGLTEIKLEENDFYIVNYDTEEVIYSKGYKTEDETTYYKLTDIKKLIEQM